VLRGADSAVPADGWRDIDAYAASFATIDVVQLVPVLGFGLSLLAFLAATVLLAIHFRRLGRSASAPSGGPVA
jgi:hypothetical protein